MRRTGHNEPRWAQMVARVLKLVVRLVAATPLALVAALLLVVAPSSAVHAEPKRVLLLHSFGQDFAPYDSFSANFRTYLAQRSPDPVDIYDASLLSARFNENEDDAPFVAYLESLFSTHHLDLVVPIGGPAVLFSQRNRERLFANVPMLMSALDERHLKDVHLTPNDAVVAVKLDIP